MQVEYDPAKVSYEKLLEVFWRNIDPTQKDAQFCDHGSHYRSAIFYHDEEQRRLAEASRAALAKNKPFKGEIVTQIAKADVFYPAEGYHQDYHLKNPVRYKFYKTGCGREARLQQLWGKPREIGSSETDLIWLIPSSVRTPCASSTWLFAIRLRQGSASVDVRAGRTSSPSACNAGALRLADLDR